MFWAFVKCNLRDGADPEAFHSWYNNQHAPRYIAQPGFLRGWRLEQRDHPTEKGTSEQRYVAIYETLSVSAFNEALERDLASGHPWEDWEPRIKDWQRTYYRRLLSFGAEHPVTGQGTSWIVVRVDFKTIRLEEEQDFDAWYNDQHVPEMTAVRGFRRAWRLQLEPDNNDLGPRGQKFVAVYEADHHDCLPQVLEGAGLWRGFRTNRIRNLNVNIYRKIYDFEEERARD